MIIPGELFADGADWPLNPGRRTLTLVVENSGDRPIQVGSHYHFAETNAALKFDRTAALINRHPDRFLFGSDVVAPGTLEAQQKVYDMYAPLWGALTPEASRKVRLDNYQRIFNQARVRVRAWEERNRVAK